jgi:pimeloyl-ACP methyl ester carboxylesterase
MSLNWIQSRIHRTLLFAWRQRYWLAALLAAVLLYQAWGELTRTRGAQEVIFEAATASCGEKGALRYCIYRAGAGSNGDVLYHLHGRNLDEQVWNDDTYFTALIQSEWQRARTLPPTVVSISYGSTWLLAPRGQKPDSGLLEAFIADIETIESTIGEPDRRLLLGESMGGLNVLVAGLTYPDRFAKVASLCPGVYADSPFASFDSMRAAAKRTGANPKIAFGVWLLARQHLANEDEWRKFSPLELIAKADARYPALYLSNGLYDSYGNFEGTQKLAEISEDRGVHTEWRPMYGGHCSIDATSLAAFLSSP